MKVPNYCKGCGELKKLIKAHVIPEKFFVSMHGSEGPIKEYSIEKNSYPKKRPIGVYDKEILCRDCEDKFQLVDEYGQNILIKRVGELKVFTKDGVDSYYTLNEVDGDKLKRFLVAIVWRASISNNDFYSKINLGKFESRAKEIVWGSNFDSLSEFAFTITRYRESKFGQIVANPQLIKAQGINMIRLTIPQYLIHIKVDSRSGPESLLRLQTDGIGVLTMGAREFEFSWEYENYRNVIVN